MAALASAWFAPQAGATLAFTRGGFSTTPPAVPAPETLWTARNDGSAPRRLTAGSEAVVSPNGRLVLYDVFTNGTARLAVTPANGGRSRTLLTNWSGGPEAWSPDSQTIVTVAGPGAGLERLVVIDVASGRTRTLARATGFTGVSFSPHGSSIVFGSARGNLYTLELASHEDQKRLVSDGRSSQPLWGPAWIVFSRSRPSTRPNDAPKQDLYLIKASGAGLHRLTYTNPGYLLAGLFPTAWSADGRRLLAQFSGQDTSYAETVDPRTGHVQRVGTPAQGLIGWGLSRNGSSILATTGGPDPNDSDVVAVPYAGGTPRVLARHAHYPSWNA